MNPTENYIPFREIASQAHNGAGGRLSLVLLLFIAENSMFLAYKMKTLFNYANFRAGDFD